MKEIEDNNNIEEKPENTEDQPGDLHKTLHLTGMYKNWFLDYASYVILERAVPEITDGLKPVHRRILHAMKDLDDGRYNKVASIIGHTMKYHPHGDASIGDSLVQLGQKELLIDTQGNWGNTLTGDRAAAPRYIEARLSKFALEVLFNPKTTIWKASYDGRNKEPITLPVKFPLLLVQGVEGIAVGLSSKILPHNFNELIDASIYLLRGIEKDIFPDFLTGGMADFSRYNDGKRGGRIRLRAKISQLDKKNLIITEIPHATTTTSLIESVIAANDKGKIKIKKIDDNTAENVEVIIRLAQGISPDTTIDALYAFTNCEVSIAPNSCIIEDQKPRFIGVKEILKISTKNTVALLKKELEIQKDELEESWHFASLEKIFIKNRIYRDIEECETWQSVLDAIDKGLDPYKHIFHREITKDDIVRLTEIKIKRISKYDSFKADDVIRAIEDDIKEVIRHLENLIDYAIEYYKRIKKKYGKGRERKTEVRNFDTIQATMVAAATKKLYINWEEGFVGTMLKKNEYLCDCSDIDDIIFFRSDGTMMVTKVTDKVFVGKNLLHIGIFKKNDDRTIYNMIYRDGLRGKILVKRFAVKGITRDKEYDLTKGTKGSKVLYFTANPNGEAEVIKVNLKPKPRLRNLSFEFEFSSLDIKGRSSKGNILTKYTVKNILQKEEGVSTLGAREIWYDDTVNRLNAEQRGQYLGAFKGDDKILTITRSGYFKILNYDLSNHFDEDILLIEKFYSEKTITAVYNDGKSNNYYVKRFNLDSTSDADKKINFIAGHSDSKLVVLSIDKHPQIELFLEKKNKSTLQEIVDLNDFIGVKTYKAKGKRLTTFLVKKIILLNTIQSEKESEGIAIETKENKKDELLKIEHSKQSQPLPEPDTAVKQEPKPDKSKPKPETKLKPISKTKPKSNSSDDQTQMEFDF